MGIVRNQSTGKGVTFVDIKGRPQVFTDGEGKEKHGALVISNPDKTKEVLPTNSAIVGIVTSVDVRSHVYQEETINSLQIRVEDVDGVEPPVVMSATLGSFFAAKIVGLLNGADLRLPIKFICNSILQGEKFGTGVSAKDNVFPSIRQGVANDRVVPVWANGLAQLPDAIPVLVNGKPFVVNGRAQSDMTPVHEVVAATIGEIYAKIDAIKAGEIESGPTDDDQGLTADEVNAAAALAGGQHERQR